MANNNERATLPPTLAQQVFTIGSGVAGGLAGVLLARRLIAADEVPTGQVALAVIVSAVATVGAVSFIRPIQKE